MLYVLVLFATDCIRSPPFFCHVQTPEPIKYVLACPFVCTRKQVAVEKVILQQENGSMAQRVQAEFLSELCRRIELACPDRPPGPGMLE